MSIRLRLLLMCVVVAILPALPLTVLVQDLLETSFNVGLSTTVSDALDSGMAISRRHMSRLQTDFEDQVQRMVAIAETERPDSVAIADALVQLGSARQVDGFLLAKRTQQGMAATTLPEELEAFASGADLQSLVAGAEIRSRPPRLAAVTGVSFFETENKAVQLALWQPAGVTDQGVLLYQHIDPQFLERAGQLLAGNQMFAQLRLEQPLLSRSFFYPFMVVYGVVLAVALVLALVMSERMSAPIRRLSVAAEEVAGGNWNVRLKRATGGEIGRLIDAFNTMVSRLDAQQRRLLEVERIAGWREMARHLAHEIKNPLLPIRLAVQEMRDQYKGTDETYRACVQESTRVVEDELEHLQRLVKEFSGFAKMPGLSATTGSLLQLVKDVAGLYPQVNTRIHAEPTLTESCFDSDQIRRVLVNLFDNAVSVAADGQQVQVTIALDQRDQHLRLTFSDNGSGIEDEHLPRVFEPYYTTRSAGTGLGLALVKSIVVMHEGTIEVASPAAGGAQFTLTLPQGGPLAAQADANSQQEG